MPSQHRYAYRGLRPGPQLYERAKDAVAEVDSNVDARLVAFPCWLAGDTGELPPRPARRIPDRPDAEALRD